MEPLQETKRFNEQRAEIYWWLSSLFAKELTTEELEKYHSPEIRSFLTGLSENPTLKSAIDNLVDALNRLQTREDAQLELSADFCELFLQSDKHASLPYASIYLEKDKQLNGKPAHAMAKLLEDSGFKVDENLNEPADHLAIQLDYLGNLIIRSNELEQASHLETAFIEQSKFIHEHLLTWIPTFEKECTKHDEFGFYGAVAQVLIAFCQLDSQYLATE